MALARTIYLGGKSLTDKTAETGSVSFVVSHAAFFGLSPFALVETRQIQQQSTSKVAQFSLLLSFSPR
jgi:hypothetical protein